MAEIHSLPGIRDKLYPDLIRALIVAARSAHGMKGFSNETLRDVLDLVHHARQGLRPDEITKLAYLYKALTTDLWDAEALALKVGMKGVRP